MFNWTTDLNDRVIGAKMPLVYAVVCVIFEIPENCLKLNRMLIFASKVVPVKLHIEYVFVDMNPPSVEFIYDYLLFKAIWIK